LLQVNESNRAAKSSWKIFRKNNA